MSNPSVDEVEFRRGRRTTSSVEVDPDSTAAVEKFLTGDEGLSNPSDDDVEFLRGREDVSGSGWCGSDWVEGSVAVCRKRDLPCSCKVLRTPRDSALVSETLELRIRGRFVCDWGCVCITTERRGTGSSFSSDAKDPSTLAETAFACETALPAA